MNDKQDPIAHAARLLREAAQELRQEHTYPRSPRWVLQRWASFKRRFIPDYYARIVERWIGRQLSCGWHRIVVTDLRDPVEWAILERLGGKVVRVHRPELRTLTADTAMNVSEQHHRIAAHAANSCGASLQSGMAEAPHAG